MNYPFMQGKNYRNCHFNSKFSNKICANFQFDFFKGLIENLAVLNVFLATTIVLTVHDSLHLGSKSKVLVSRRKFTRSVMYKVRVLCRVVEILFPCKFGFRN